MIICIDIYTKVYIMKYHLNYNEMSSYSCFKILQAGISICSFWCVNNITKKYRDTFTIYLGIYRQIPLLVKELGFLKIDLAQLCRQKRFDFRNY